MRLIRSVVFAMFFIGITGASHAQDEGKDDFIKSIFSTLQKKDKHAYVKLFPDLPTFKRITNEIIGNEEAMVNKTKEINGWTQADYDSLLITSLQKEFNRIILNAEKKGVDWASARLTKWIEDEEDKASIEQAGLKMLFATAYFTSKGKEFEIAFSQIIWSANDKRWYGVDLENVRVKGERYNNDDLGAIMDGVNAPPAADSVYVGPVAVDSVYVGPAPAKPVIDAPNKVPAKNKPVKPATTKPPVKKDN